MPLPTGIYSKGITGGFVEEKRYVSGLVQAHIPWTDADENMKEAARYTSMRRAFQILVDSSSPNRGFLCVGDGASNDFQISGDAAEPLGGGILFVGGHKCVLIPDVRYVNQATNLGEKSIYAQVTAVGPDFIEDSSALFVANELVGRTVVPDVTQPGTSFTVTANTTNRITVAGNPQTSGISVGDRYRLNLTTPAAGRTDAVYVNVYLDEIDGDEDPDILHAIGSLVEAQRFLQIIQTIFVREDVPTWGELPTTYTDADGNKHATLKIATLTRFTTQAAINAPDLVDLRKTSGDLTTFVRKQGDTMTGPLVLAAGSQIVAADGVTIDGRDVSIDGAKLDTIDWSPAGVAGELKFQGRGVQGDDLNGVTGATVNVSHGFRTKVAGGADGVAGVVTAPPYNLSKIKTKLGRDEILSGVDHVYGRLTGPNQLALSGTLHLDNASTNVTGVGTLFNSELQVGDIVTRDDDGRYIGVAAILSDTQFTAVEAWPGSSADGTGTRRRFVLSFFTTPDTGTEAAYTFAAPTDLAWAYLQIFSLDQIPVYPEDWVFPSEQVAGEIPDATTLQAGKVLLAADLETTAGKVVDASDDRVNFPLQSDATVGRFDKLTAGPNVTIDTSGGKLRINVPTGGTGGTGATGSQGPAGPSGPGFTNLATFSKGGAIGRGGGGATVTANETFTFSFTPKMYMVTIAYIQAAPNATTDSDDTFEINSVTVSGTTILVNYTYTENSGVGDLTVKIGCTAAG